MTAVEVKIIRRDINEQNQVQALTGSIGGVIFQARGMGSFVQNDKFPELGFRGGWSSGKDPNITPNQNRAFLAQEVAQSIADVSHKRGFQKHVDRVRLGSGSAPIGIEDEVKKILQEKYQLEVGYITRDSLACNGMVWALTQAAQETSGSQIIATFEHPSPFKQGSSEIIQELFGDGIAAIAFNAGDLSVLTTRTLFDQDTQNVLTLPHTRAGTLAPTEGRLSFTGDLTCIIRGDNGHVFTYRGGVHQPLAASPPDQSDKVTMKGGRLGTYFAINAPEVMKVVFNAYLEKYGEEGIRDLNPYGVIHQPSKPVFDKVIDKIQETIVQDIRTAKEGKQRIISRLGEIIQHIWTPELPTTELHHNNVSGATAVFSLLGLIAAGEIKKGNIMFTGMGVGNNITSTIFQFN